MSYSNPQHRLTEEDTLEDAIGKMSSVITQLLKLNEELHSRLKSEMDSNDAMRATLEEQDRVRF